MDKQRQALFNKIYDIINGYIDSEETSAWVTSGVINLLPIVPEPSEVSKPVIGYYIRFYGYMGKLERIKETLYSNYQKGNIIRYKDARYIVKKVIIDEGEDEIDVIIHAHLTDYS